MKVPAIWTGWRSYTWTTGNCSSAIAASLSLGLSASNTARTTKSPCLQTARTPQSTPRNWKNSNRYGPPRKRQWTNCSREQKIRNNIKRFSFRNINTVGTTEIHACGDMSEDAHSAQEAHESSVRG